MASIIRIKRSSTSGNPNTLGAGELAYSALTDNGSNGGDRLYIGIGTETAGNAANHIVIGGKYFTDLVSAATSLNTASAIVKRDASGNFSAGTITASLSGNASTATTLQTARTIAFTGDATASGTFDGSANYSQALTLATVNTNVGSFGSSTQIPVITVNGKGLVTAVSTAAISTTLQLAGGGGTTGSVALASGTLTFTGGNGITTSVSGGVVTIASIGAGGYTSTATGGTTTTLTASSSANQYFTGTTTQTVKLPSTATLTVGQEFIITNNSTGNLTLQTSAAGALGTVLAGTQVTFTVASTSTETWVQEITGFNAVTGTGSNVLATGPTLSSPVISTIINTGTLTLPTSTDTLVGRATTDTFTNKTINIQSGQGNTFQIQGNSITSYTGSGAVVMLSATPTITGGINYSGSSTGQTTLQASATASGTLTLPAATDTLVGKATTDTFTNKTFDTAGVGNSLKINGTAITAVTGSGSVVLATSPTLVTPNLGTPTAVVLTNATGLPLTSGVTGTLPVANGGTGTTTGSITGTGALTFTAGGTNNNVNLVATGTGTVDVANARITSVGTPTQTTDAATKGYVDSVKQALDIKDSVRVATTGNLTSTASGTGAGKTLTNAGTQAAITIDSIVLNAGDRVLVKDQTTAANNGIYTVTTVGTASTNWVLTRATDADNSPSGEVTPGMFTFVEEGTVNADSGWVLTTDGAVTIDTTSLTFVQFSGAGQVIAGNGLTKTGNQIDVVGTSNRISVFADNIDIASTYVGQTSLTTLGTITTGTWNGTIISAAYGGTGINNGSNTITLGGSIVTAGSFTTAGAYALTLTTTGATSVTLPTSGTLATLAGSETLSNKTITSSSFSGSTVTTTGNASIGGTLSVTSTSAFTGSVTMSANLTGAGAATSTIDGFQIDGGTY